MDTAELDTKIIIEGIKENGQKFRPSDWPERVSGLFATFSSDHRLIYNSHLRPGMINGDKCLIVDKRLQSDNPDAYNYIMQFARENQLKTHGL